MATRGNNAQFTYDFGIAIAQSTVNKVARLTGVTLSLASAFYALKSTASEYVATLRENTFRYGGVIATMKQMEQAQKRLISGRTLFSVDDQLKGINQLMAAGLDVGKNLDWVSKAAHASGQSFAQFSGAISNAIAGNMGQLVDMGLMTQRATRAFDKYTANTVQRQQAIMNFLKNHKGILGAIRNDFETVQDQMMRINAMWKAFLNSILGKPNDPMSLYGQLVSSMRLVADALARNIEQIKRIGYVIGSVLGWVIKQVGHFVVWLGKQVRDTLNLTEKATNGYVEFTRSLIVWLEFWKLKVVDFFDEYGGAIKAVLKLVLAYKALKFAFVISRSAITSVMALWTTLKGIVRTQKLIYSFQLALGSSKIRALFMSMSVWMPAPFKAAYVDSVAFFSPLPGRASAMSKAIAPIFRNLGRLMAAPFIGLPKIAYGAFKGVVGAAGVLSSGAMTGALSLDPRANTTQLKSTFKSFQKTFMNGLRLLKKGFAAFLVPTLGLVKDFFRLFTGGFTGLVSKGKWAIQALRAGFMALNATNPLGWIILGVTALVILYKKFGWFRKYINLLMKGWWEYAKLLWNTIYGAVIGIGVVFKRIFNKIGSGINWAIKGIKKMWAAFKDTMAGRVIGWVFDKIKDGIKWVLDMLAKINDSMAAKIRQWEKELGFSRSFAAEGGNYDADDSTDYLSFDGLGKAFGGDEKPPAEPANPVIGAESGAYGGGSGVSNTYNYQNGAIQVNINVPDSANLDETKLSKIVRKELQNALREEKMRGGSI